ncbi:hypothetical protein CIRG_09886 [Coccidioides immitis RMSCC 2394]|uniref:Uncharacterized protein n=1 Tax=Coccidioides immitis RMSCC 2394 TaxID=404692 RepID=A0A0J6YQY3_COCIT|nr:hypothetical protein CIRG_09886 [Coccidioides immitis RMSCC 2394]
MSPLLGYKYGAAPSAVARELEPFGTLSPSPPSSSPGEITPTSSTVFLLAELAALVTPRVIPGPYSNTVSGSYAVPHLFLIFLDAPHAPSSPCSGTPPPGGPRR